MMRTVYQESLLSTISTHVARKKRIEKVYKEVGLNTEILRL